MKHTNKVLLSILLLTSFIFGCTKTGSILGNWSLTYHFTSPSVTNGNFTANFKSNNMYDYVESASAINQTDEGSWSTTGDSIIFTFSKHGTASYRGTKTSNAMSGKIVLSGIDAGTFTGTK